MNVSAVCLANGNISSYLQKSESKKQYPSQWISTIGAYVSLQNIHVTQFDCQYKTLSSNHTLAMLVSNLIYIVNDIITDNRYHSLINCNVGDCANLAVAQC